jgi:hypothetical protein
VKRELAGGGGCRLYLERCVEGRATDVAAAVEAEKCLTLNINHLQQCIHFCVLLD